MKWDEEFEQCTWEDIRDNITAIAKSKAKNPTPRQTLIYSFDGRRQQRIVVEVRRVPS